MKAENVVVLKRKLQNENSVYKFHYKHNDWIFTSKKYA